MTISTSTRVQRGYFRVYREKNLNVLRSYNAGYKRWLYRLGWAEWLIEELTEYWSAEAMGVTPPKLDTMLHSRPTSGQWMNYVSAGRSRLSTGSPEKRIPSTT
jgi:hypothetical protein